MGLEYRVLEDSDVQNASECIARAFSTNDVLSIALGIGLEDWRKFAKQETLKSIDDGLSIGAFDEDKLVGVSLVCDLAKYNSEGYNEIESFVPIYNLLNELSRGYEMKGRIAHASLLGVMPKYTDNPRVAVRIIKDSVGLIRSEGYDKIVGEMTSPYAQMVTRLAGFRAINEISYKDFIYKGEKIFKGIINAKSCMLMELKL